MEVEVVKAVAAPVTPASIRAVLLGALTVPEIRARLPEAISSVAVRLTSDRELRRLNLRYAGEDHTTDVLSFEGDADHLGDIAISWPAVKAQAVQHGHPESTELAVLCVHGLLHLLGWDHAGASERSEMNRLTLAALKASRIEPDMRRVWSG